MINIFVEDTLSYGIVKKRVAEFKQNKEITEHEWGHPKTSATDEQLDANYGMIMCDRRLTVQQMAKCIGMSYDSVPTVLTKIWG